MMNIYYVIRCVIERPCVDIGCGVTLGWHADRCATIALKYAFMGDRAYAQFGQLDEFQAAALQAKMQFLSGWLHPPAALIQVPCGHQQCRRHSDDGSQRLGVLTLQCVSVGRRKCSTPLLELESTSTRSFAATASRPCSRCVGCFLSTCMSVWITHVIWCTDAGHSGHDSTRHGPAPWIHAQG